MNPDHPPPPNGSPANGPTYSTVGPGQWPSPTATPDQPGPFRRIANWLKKRRDTREKDRYWQEVHEGRRVSRFVADADLPDLPHFRSELARPPASSVTGRPAAKREPGDHTCMIRHRPLQQNASWYYDYVSSGGGRTNSIASARKFSCPGAAADWWAANRKPEHVYLSPAIIHAATGDVVIELTEEVVTGTPGE